MKLAEFAANVINHSAFIGCDLDGGSVQELAEHCGLIVKTKYDPAVHGSSEASEYVEPGGDWYVFSDELQAAIAAENK